MVALPVDVRLPVHLAIGTLAVQHVDRPVVTAAWTRLRLACPLCRGALASRSSSWDCSACGSSYAVQAGVLHLSRGREGAPGYDPHYFRTLQAIEGRHFWFVGRREVILDSIRRSVPDVGARSLFDIGCGTGGLLSFLAANGVSVSGACDAYPESLQLVRSRLDVPLVLVDEGRLPPLACGYELLSMFDVLEHVDDDLAMLRFLWSALLPGGVLVLTVPAHPFLYDEMDHLAHHRRRYTRGELRERLAAAGFEVRLLTHFMSPLVPLLATLRACGRLLPHGAALRRQKEFQVVPGLNGVMNGVLAAERSLMRVWSLPFGTSLIAVAARPAADR
jgi:2-polyprenyl-3-methyl-5-hydroxy-6-metoxy-1,4-benzoquinol methylase